MIINTGNLRTLYRAFNTAFLDGFGQAPADHEPIVVEVSSMTSEEEYGWLGQWPSLRKWVGERVLRGIEQHDYTIKNEKYESTIYVKGDHVRDDKYGVYSMMFNEMGRAAGAHPCELAFALLKMGFSELCYDGQYFFDTDHDDGKGGSASNSGGGPANGTPWFLLDCSRMLKPIIFQKRKDYEMVYMDDPNDERVFMADELRYGIDGRCNVGFGLWQLGYGSRAALNKDNYKTARETMMAFTGDEGRPLGIKPTHLVVPPALEGEALEVLKAERDAAGATNVYANTATLITSPWLA